MRTRPAIRLVLWGLLLWVAGSEQSQAQSGGFDPRSTGAPDFGFMGAAQTGNPPVGYSGLPPGGFPLQANPWPQVSPFAGPPVEQHSFENGLWFRDQKWNTKKQLRVTVEGLYARIQSPNQTPIGDPTIPPYEAEITSTSGTGGGGAGAGTGGGPVFVMDSARATGPLISGGIRTTVDFLNPDESGFRWSGFYLGQADGEFKLGQEILPSSTVTVQFIPLELRGISVDNGLGYQVVIPPTLPNGEPAGGTGGTGTTTTAIPVQTPQEARNQPYDLLYQLNYQTQTIGTNLDYLLAPILDRPSFKLQPLVGVRYLNIDEQFRFRGIFSGLEYGDAVTVDRTTGEVTTAGTVANLPMVSRLTSQAYSQLAGPELGLRASLGGEKFKVISQSKLGLYANWSRVDLNGANIGIYDEIFNRPIGSPSTEFADSRRKNNFSPAFEQQIGIEAPLLRLIPLINKTDFAQHSMFSCGYSILIVGNVRRPADSIRWQGFPLQPTVNERLSQFYISQFNAGFSYTW